MSPETKTGEEPSTIRNAGFISITEISDVAKRAVEAYGQPIPTIRPNAEEGALCVQITQRDNQIHLATLSYLPYRNGTVFQLASEGRRYFWWPDSPEDKTRQKVLIHSEGAIVERKGFNQEDVRHISDTIGNLALDRKE